MTKTSPLLILVLCWLALLADGFDLYVYGATLPAILADPDWGVTPGSAAFVGSAALVGMLVGSLLAGILSDRWGRKRLLVLSVGLFTLGMLGCALSPSFEVFAVFRFVTCLGAGGLLPTAVATANENAVGNKRSISVGLVLTGPPVGSLLSALTASALVAEHGFRTVYAIGTASILVCLLLAVFMPGTRATPRRHAAVQAPRRQSVGALFSGGRTRKTLLVWAACLVSLLTTFGITTWLPVIMQNAGFAAGSSITFLAIYAAGAVVGTVLACLAAELTAPKYLTITGFAAAALALLVVSVSHAPAVLVVAIFVAGFGGLGTQNMLNDHIAQSYPTDVRATGLGWALSVGRIGAIVGPTYGALAAGLGGGSASAAALAFAVPATIGTLLAILMPRANATDTVTIVPSTHPLDKEPA